MNLESSNIAYRGKKLLKEPLPQGYSLRQEEEVYSFLKASFSPWLEQYLDVFEDWRRDTNQQAVERSQLKELPFGSNNSLWRARRDDLEIVKQVLGAKKALRILETGSWNGWLSQQLSKMGHEVVAIDYFRDDLDGVRARKHYPNPNWCSLQMDVEDLDLLQPDFDAVLFNRNLAHCPGISSTLKKAKELLVPGGFVLATGIHIVRDTAAAEIGFRASEEYFKARGISFALKENIKKYLCKDDVPVIENEGFQLQPYTRSFLGGLKQLVIKPSSTAYWALYQS